MSANIQLSCKYFDMLSLMIFYLLFTHTKLEIVTISPKCQPHLALFQSAGYTKVSVKTEAWAIKK